MRLRNWRVGLGSVMVMLVSAGWARAAVVTFDAATGAEQVIYASPRLVWSESGFQIDVSIDGNHAEYGWLGRFQALQWHKANSNLSPNDLIGHLASLGTYDLQSLEVLDNLEGLLFTSSRGGSVTLPAHVTGVVSFAADPLFSDITSFRIGILGNDNSFPHAIDNIHFSVPDTSTAWGLLSIGLSALGGFRRRQVSA